VQLLVHGTPTVDDVHTLLLQVRPLQQLGLHGAPEPEQPPFEQFPKLQTNPPLQTLPLQQGWLRFPHPLPVQVPLLQTRPPLHVFPQQSWPMFPQLLPPQMPELHVRPPLHTDPPQQGCPLFPQPPPLLQLGVFPGPTQQPD
jgi:hypothetical protein